MSHYSISNEAIEDVVKFHQYLIDQNGLSVSEDFIEGIFNKFQLLAEFSGIGRSRNEISKDLLSFPDVKFNQNIYYEKSAGGIHVIRVLGGRQDHLSILK